MDNIKLDVTLTSREMEIFEKLIRGGGGSKEIAHSLNISYDTYKTHKKNLYRKLNVNNLNELLIKYGDKQGALKPVVFTRWVENKDDLGSVLNLSEKIEEIEGQFFHTLTLSGKLATVNNAFAGAYAIPDPDTHELMKKMNSFSFKVLGDGNTYVVFITTKDSRLQSGNNHYRKSFTTENGVLQKIVINIDELQQSPLFGNPVPFIKENIEFFQIHGYTTRDFSLKFWDIRFI